MITVQEHLKHIRQQGTRRSLIQTPEDYLAWATKQYGDNHENAPMHDSTVPKVARIDWGRWLIDCDCGTSLIVNPDWPYAPCPECGTVHRVIVFPENREAIEAAINQRAQKAQFWSPGETVDELQAENRAHGIGVEP